MIRSIQLFVMLLQFHFGSLFELNISCPISTTCYLRIQESIEPHKMAETTTPTVYLNVTILDIIESKASRLPSNLMQIFPNLEFLKADNCGLEYIQPEIFGRSAEVNSTRLQSIKMLANNIKTIENFTFEKCINLVFIDLANNSINTIGSEAFAGLSNLDYLDLKNNQLLILDESVFADCPLLTAIYLENNQLTDTVCINNLTNMITLDLSYNENIKLIKSSVQNFGATLTSLSLNGIKHSTAELFEFSSQFNNLEFLSIEYNEIRILNTYNIPYMPKLKHLDLCGNELEVLPVDGIRNKFPNLKKIYIDVNKWECNQLELMLIKLNNSGIIPYSHQENQELDKNDKSQVYGFDCRSLEEILDANKPDESKNELSMNIVAIIIGTLIGLIAVLLLLVYLKLGRLATTIAVTTSNEDYNWNDDNYASLDGSPRNSVSPYETIVMGKNVEMNPIYDETKYVEIDEGIEDTCA